MELYACGFLGQQQPVSTSFTAVAGPPITSVLVPGGWGCAGVLSEGLLRLHGANSTVCVQLDNCSLHQLFMLGHETSHSYAAWPQPAAIRPPLGSASAAALGWSHAVASSGSGQLFACNLASNQPAESTQGNSTASSQSTLLGPHSNPASWDRLQIAGHVISVAAGEHHR